MSGAMKVRRLKVAIIIQDDERVGLDHHPVQQRAHLAPERVVAVRLARGVRHEGGDGERGDEREAPRSSGRWRRQPKALPTAVPSGTPKTLATPMPPTTIESALARQIYQGTLEVASTIASPKKVPCAAAATTRPAMSTAKLGAMARARWGDEKQAAARR